MKSKVLGSSGIDKKRKNSKKSRKGMRGEEKLRSIVRS